MANNESDKLNTGLPGFVVDGRLHQMTPGDPDLVDPADPVSPTEKKGRLIGADLTGDISRSTKNTLADYLGRSTTKKNYYPLDGDSFNQGTSQLKEFGEKTNQVVGAADVSSFDQLTKRTNSIFRKKPEAPPSSRETRISSPGDSYVPPIEPTSNSNYFAEREDLGLAAEPAELRGWFPPRSNVAETLGVPSLPFVKGRGPGWDEFGTTTGNNLMRDDLDPSQPSLVTTEKALRVLSQNRFTPRGALNPSIEYDVSMPPPPPEDSEATIGVSFRGGRWARSDQGIIEGSFHGESLRAAVSGSANYNPPLHNPRYPELHVNDMAIASDVLLNGARINGKDERKEYSSLNEVFGALAYGEDLDKNIEFISIKDDSNKNNYTSLRRFDGASGVVMTALGQFSLKQIAQKILEKFNDELPIDGYFLFKKNFSVSELQKSIGVGLDVFYNQNSGLISAYITKNPKVPSWLLPKSGASYGNEGILVETSKSIMRAINEYEISLKNLPATNDLDAIKLFSKSRLAKILVAFSKIGEAQIAREEKINDSVTGKSDNPHWEKPGLQELKWSSNLAESRFLLDLDFGPKASIRGPLSAGTEGARSLVNHHYGVGDVTQPSRIPREEVEILERKLDSDYMPFYFHDLRTNEIITFHAFLSSLADGFSASYDSIEGFGRVEPIKIYKGTQRKISMEFSVVSTSEEDFNVMWHKINKLVTLVYPQYTEGRRLEKNGYNFVQPFSQMMGASPLIRIRLGNVFRSNYSRFALAKLFGAGLDEKISFKKNEAQIKEAETKANETRQERSRERILVEKKAEISAKILEKSRDFSADSNIKFLLKNPGAVNSQKGQIPNFKSLFKNNGHLAKNLCCVVLSTENLPQRTGTRTITEKKTVFDEQATLARDQRINNQEEALRERERLLAERGQIAGDITVANTGLGVALAKAQATYVENTSKALSASEPIVSNYAARQWRAQDRQKRLQQQKIDFEQVGTATARLEALKAQALENESAYEVNENFISENELDSSPPDIDPNFVGPLTREEGVTRTKTYKWTPVLVTLKMGLSEGDLDNLNDEKLKEDLKRFKELNPNLDDNIIIKTLSGNLKLSNTELKRIEDSFVNETTPPSPEAAPAPPEPAPDDIDPLLAFMDPANNSLVKSFEEAGGKGLAGVIESLDFSWLDQAMWDIDGGIDGGNPEGRKAPMMCKVSISFAPIHDISPGLDSKGRNRAPVYPVGLAHIPDKNSG